MHNCRLTVAGIAGCRIVTQNSQQDSAMSTISKRTSETAIRFRIPSLGRFTGIAIVAAIDTAAADAAGSTSVWGHDGWKMDGPFAAGRTGEASQDRVADLWHTV